MMPPIDPTSFVVGMATVIIFGYIIFLFRSDEDE